MRLLVAVFLLLAVSVSADYQSDYATATDETFRQRLSVALSDVAVDVVGEASSGNATIDKKRHDLGVSILRDPTGAAGRYGLALVAGGALTTSSTDQDIYNRITAVYNDLAGVAAAD